MVLKGPAALMGPAFQFGWRTKDIGQAEVSQQKPLYLWPLGPWRVVEGMSA
jgi:hypothetical protein